MNFKIIKSYAKINLSLGVTGRLNSKYHKIESLVSFLKLHDEVKIRKINKKKHKIQFFGKFSKGINKENTVSKLLKILDEKNLLNNEKYFIKIKKNIPHKSGLGGGSMNASALIRFFIYKKILNLSKKNIIKLSKKVGQDVQFGLDNKIKIDSMSFSKKDYYFGIRPEHFEVSENSQYKFSPHIDLIENLGNEKIAYIKIDNYDISAKIPSQNTIGKQIGFSSKNIFVFDENGVRLKS